MCVGLLVSNYRSILRDTLGKKEMNLNEIVDLERGQRPQLIQWLQRRYLLPDPLNCAQCNQAMELKESNGEHVDGYLW